MNLKSLVISLFVSSLLLFTTQVYAENICFSVEDAKKLLVEVSEGRINKEILNTQEEIIANLKQQNKLLEENIRLLQEQVKLLRGQVEVLKVAYEEERKKSSLSFFEKGKMF
ncbi:MAG: hypothetical protein QXS63_04955, partial [Zestosphaera sp.]